METLSPLEWGRGAGDGGGSLRKVLSYDTRNFLLYDAIAMGLYIIKIIIPYEFQGFI